MSRYFTWLMIVLGTFSSTAAWAQLAAPIITEETARRHGLHRSWITRVEMDSGRDKVASVVYYQPEPLPAKAGAAKANPMQPPAAAAQDANQPADAAAPPAPAAQAAVVVQPGVLVVVTERGLVQTFNSETGQSLWAKQVGSRNKYHSEPAVNSRFVVLLEGTVLHVLDRATGDLVQSKDTKAITMTAPAISEEWVYVPSLRGELYAFRLPVEEGQAEPAVKGAAKPAPTDKKYAKQEIGASYSDENRWNYSSFGRIDVPPVALRTRIAWATQRGFLYSSKLDQAVVDGRFETKRAVSAPLSYWPPYIFVASRDGSVYAVPESTSGTILWRYPAGDSISHKPVALGDSVYVIPENHVMQCIAMRDGALRWSLPEIVQFVSASPTRVYVKDSQGRLLIVDAKTGARLSQLDVGRLNVTVSNDRSDRIFLGTDEGLLFCLHEAALKSPVVHVFPSEAEIQKAAVAAAAARPAPMAQEGAGNN